MHSLKCLLLGLILPAFLQNFAGAQHVAPPETPGLHNLTRLSADVYSGSEPADEEAFDSLLKLGIQTIVSVDGATPKIDLAKEHSMRYVHIPFGYDSIPATAQLLLTRAAREAKTPLYVHCHHGKHRGPAAAAIVCRAKGIVDLPGALKIMQNAGTSRDYKGLWRDVELYEVPPIGTQLPELVEVAKVESLAAAMARIDRNFDNLKLCSAADWNSPADHPDLVPQQEALQLQESLYESCRRLAERAHASDYDAEFRQLLTESDAVALVLYQSLKSKDAVTATTAFATLADNCTRCHTKYRDR